MTFAHYFTLLCNFKCIISQIFYTSQYSHQQIIGTNNLIMGSCHIAHDCKMGNHNIFANNTLLAGHVNVEVWPQVFASNLDS